jgi:hydroxymethylpyrimidine pyrophosphatase-like HAD family hydrolase
VTVSALVGPLPADDGPRLRDLQLSLGDVADLLDDVGDAGPLDPFLLAAGASQVLRDAVESDPASVLRVTSHAAARAPGRLRGILERTGALAARALDAGRDTTGSRARLEDAVHRLEATLDPLAEAVLAKESDEAAVAAARAALRASIERDPRTASAPLRLPSCFRSFDLHPNDVRALARRVTDLALGPRLLVVGVRTSGSYLAPLLAASLRLDVDLDLDLDVRWCTLRPGRPLTPAVRARLANEANLGARVVLVDDPPSSGRSLARTAQQVRAAGVPGDAVSVAFALHDGGGVPDALAGLPAALLDWPDWDVHRRLGADAVAAVWRDAGGDDALVALRPVELPERPSPESHARAGYVATVAGPKGERDLELVAEGVGIGLFGRHALVVADALGQTAPEVVGLRDGVLVRAWLPEAARAALESPTRVRQAVDYVVARRDALAVGADASAGLGGHRPVWEVASSLLAAPYREVGFGVRAAALDAAVRRLLAPSRPSVVDGQTGPGAWFELDGVLRKVGVAERAFSHLDLACYDATYDLAGLLAGCTDPELETLAVQRYEQRAGEHVDDERLLLYRLVQLWDRGRLGVLAPDAVANGMARAWQDWSAARLLGGRLDTGGGPWCVLDVDGVLEQSRLGAPTLTPASADGLRILRDHGYRPLLATGRGLAEVQDRCARLGLLGGVAEYGGVAYAHRDGVVRELREDRDVAALEELRERLSGVPGVRLAEGFSTMLRAYVVDRDGRRRALPPEVVDAARHASRGRVCTIRGEAQTDFVAIGVDKQRGVAALLSLLGEPDAPVAFAMGDSEPDLPMLRHAALARVPANAAELVRPWLAATAAGSQRGFREAAELAVGHDGGPCELCRRPPALVGGAALVAEVLRGLEGGRRTALAATAPLLARARRLALGEGLVEPGAATHETSRPRRSYARRATGQPARELPSGRTRAGEGSRAARPGRRRTRRGRRRA